MVIRSATLKAVWIQVFLGFLDSHRIYMYYLFYLFFFYDALNQLL